MQAFSEAEKEMLRDKLLQAAYRLFAQQGYSATTVEQLARSAKIGKGSFYLLFSSKEELFWALHSQLHESFDRRVREILSDLASHPEDTLYRFIRAVFDLFADPLVVRLEESGDLARMMRMRTADQIKEDRESTLRPLLAAVEKAQAAGVIIDGDPLVIAGAIQATCLLALHQEDIGPAFPQVTDLVVKLVARGLVKR